MRLYLVTVAKRAPDWLETGVGEYLKRLPKASQPCILAISPSGKHAHAPAAALSEEAQRIRKAVPIGARLIVFDECGESISTQQLAEQWRNWRDNATDVALVIGGAGGVADELKGTAAQTWSLSRLALPHQLVRLLVVEQLYRAWSVMNRHPYHRR